MTTTQTPPDSSAGSLSPDAATTAATQRHQAKAPQPASEPVQAPPIYRPSPRPSNLSTSAPSAAASAPPAAASEPPAAVRASEPTSADPSDATQVMRIPTPHTVLNRPLEPIQPPTVFAALEPEPTDRAGTPAPPPPSVSTTVLAAIRERWYVAGVVCLVTTILAAIAGSMLPAEYEASATVQVEAMSSSAKSAPLPEVNTASEATAARSTEIAQAVVDEVKNGKSAQQLLEQLEVVAPSNEETLRFTYTSPNAKDAAAVANAFAQAYLDARAVAIRQSVDQMRTELQDQLNAVTGAGDAAEQQRQLIREQMGQLPYGIYVGRITDKATAPTTDSSQSIVIFIAGGLMAGLILGLFAAVLVDRVDPRIRNRRRLAQIFPGPIVEANPDHHDETANQVILHLRAASGDTLTREIAVLCPAKSCADRPVEALRDQLAKEASTSTGLSHGAPVYWFDARALPSTAGRLEAATTSDAAILFVNRKDSERSLARFLTALRELGSAITVCVLVEGRERP